MLTRTFRIFITLLAAATLLTACGRNLDSAVYTSDSVVGKVLEGTVLSARPITVKDSDSTKKLGVGAIAGGAAGAVAGSNVGKGGGQTLAAVGAGILGAVAGSFIEDKLSTSEAMEYVVRLDKKYIRTYNNEILKQELRVKRSSSSIDQEIKDSIATENTTTDLLSVIQGRDTILQPGQRVLIIYNNDRPRLVASQ